MTYINTPSFAACTLAAAKEYKSRILDTVIRLLRSEVERAGGQSAWAKRKGIDRTMLNRVLRGRRPPTDEIIRALKLCNVYPFDEHQAAD